ncbi:unnamed protein product [Rotaria sp. Silwood2]|nr:unnamed protein product [Rotaria sp. Silwood2]CAF2893575.1 unnamed protein product [Rotaria sp. Silwood2]CAF3880337.1 unnamed protein product [Rotaria sp. Silwood2]CAF3895543.1 unnamed protein product [Rotaria sp. Silwood2]CAF4734453.1 unnamed protein product [Rotaria sp. Silwood2]
MLLQYNLSDFQDANEFLSKMAVKMGSLRKGGLPDIHKAAQRILSDWTNGKLTYFTEPPERTNEIISTELVTQMKEAFDIDALLNSEHEQLKDLENSSFTEITLPELARAQTDLEMNEEENLSENENSIIEAMDEDDEDHQSTTKTLDQAHFTVQAMDKTKRLLKKQAIDSADKLHDDEIRRSIHRSNLTRQQEFKKIKKNQRKLEKSMESLGDALDSIIRLTPISITNDSVDD